MPRPKRNNKKKLARLSEEEDLHAVFTKSGSGRPTFAEEIAAHLAEADLQKVLAEKGGRRPGPPSLGERVRTCPPPQEELDLHGTTGTEVAARVTGFLNAAVALHHRSVRIITGKGLHTEGPAVLPPLVEITLAEMKRSGLILHYAWDQKRRQRSGSVVVYLK